MKQEDRQLLLKDLSARLPYNPMVHIHDLDTIDYDNYLYADYLDSMMSYSITLKPYLRSMDSMTTEELTHYHDLCTWCDVGYYEFGELSTEIQYYDTVESIDYLNSIHIDYRGLIPMGLAIEAPKGMYNIN